MTDSSRPSPPAPRRRSSTTPSAAAHQAATRRRRHHPDPHRLHLGRLPSRRTERPRHRHHLGYSPGTHRPLTQADRSDSATRFYAVITDLIGTPTELITPAGAIAWQSQPTVWGVPGPSTSNDGSCPLRFPGQYADQEQGSTTTTIATTTPKPPAISQPTPSASRPPPTTMHTSTTPTRRATLWVSPRARWL